MRLQIISLLVGLHAGFISIEHKFKVGVVEFHFEGVIEHHEENEGKYLFGAEVANGDGGEEGIPVHKTLVLEIEDLKQSKNLLSGIVLQFRKQPLEGLELEVCVGFVLLVWNRHTVEQLLDFIHFDSLPEILQL